MSNKVAKSEVETEVKTEVKTPPKYGRNFFIRTYLDGRGVRRFIESLSVAKFAYIYHDKEECEKHIHLVIRLNNNTSLVSIKHKLALIGKGYDNGKDVNSNVQLASDLTDCFLYLTHSTADCIEQGKFRYDEKDIVCNDFGYFRGDFRRSSCAVGYKQERSAENNAYQIITDMEQGESLRNMVRRYGREFVINYTAYSIMLNMIQEQETSKLLYKMERQKRYKKEMEGVQPPFEEVKNETDN